MGGGAQIPKKIRAQDKKIVQSEQRKKKGSEKFAPHPPLQTYNGLSLFNDLWSPTTFETNKIMTS